MPARIYLEFYKRKRKGASTMQQTMKSMPLTCLIARVLIIGGIIKQ
ncbi:hypothetical protein [Serratia symbiotica]|uniref:Uncharacterized protein n=1 Tax=Serratia symbiotica TaxID=138074 RepID=A0A455VFU5_9GAMM|nr:hypothetical protein [Serratia symbiotica]BBI91943.1 hypothetical protein SSYIS1_14140 [Serratia symbiotica]